MSLPLSCHRWQVWQSILHSLRFALTETFKVICLNVFSISFGTNRTFWREIRKNIFFIVFRLFYLEMVVVDKAALHVKRCRSIKKPLQGQNVTSLTNKPTDGKRKVQFKMWFLFWVWNVATSFVVIEVTFKNEPSRPLFHLSCIGLSTQQYSFKTKKCEKLTI